MIGARPVASTRHLIEAVADGVVEDPETQARYLASARGELERLGRLVDDLFEPSRLDAGALWLNLEEASLGDLISHTPSGIRHQPERKEVRIVGEVSDGVDPVLAGPDYSACSTTLQPGEQRPPLHTDRRHGSSAGRA